MSDTWLKHSRAFLEAAGADPSATLDSARLAVMLAPEGESAVVRVKLPDNRAAWCRTFSTGWGCVAIAPWGSLHDCDSVARATFFASKWPRDWITPRAVKLASKRAADAPFVVDGMAWANDPAGGILLAVVEHVEPLRVILQPGAEPVTADETALSWRSLQHNVEGFRVEWEAGRWHVHNFRLAAMRAGLRVKHLAKRAERDTLTEERKAELAAAKRQKWLDAILAWRERKKAEKAQAVAAIRADKGSI